MALTAVAQALVKEIVKEFNQPRGGTDWKLRRAFARDLVSAINQDEVAAVHAGVSRPPLWAPVYFAAAWAVWPRPCSARRRSPGE